MSKKTNTKTEVTAEAVARDLGPKFHAVLAEADGLKATKKAGDEAHRKAVGENGKAENALIVHLACRMVEHSPEEKAQNKFRKEILNAMQKADHISKSQRGRFGTRTNEIARGTEHAEPLMAFGDDGAPDFAGTIAALEAAKIVTRDQLAKHFAKRPPQGVEALALKLRKAAADAYAELVVIGKANPWDARKAARDTFENAWNERALEDGHGKKRPAKTAAEKAAEKAA